MSIQNKTIFLFIFLSFLFSCQSNKENKSKLSKQQSPSSITIAFGSCNNQDREQKLWDDILAEKPDCWIWLGDNIYGDSEDMSVLRSKYNKQKSDSEYQELIANTTVLGVWDDHDYGANDAGKHYPKRAESQQELLDFLDVPKDDIRRKRKGVYSSYTIKNAIANVKIILLDARYFRDDLIREDGVNFPVIDGEILGEEQWAWLEGELKNDDADVHIIGSGIQVIPEEHRFEKWANFPKERKRLFDLMKQLDVKNPIFITGDRHIGEISKLDWDGKIIHDITSSSLTHGWAERQEEANKYRLGNLVYKINYGIIQIEKNTNKTINISLKSDNRSIEEEIIIGGKVK